MGPFAPSPVGTTRFTVGLASSSVPVTPGRQCILVTPIGNSDIVHVEFTAAGGAAIVPVAGGAKGGLAMLPGSMVEVTIPSGQAGVVTAQCNAISLTAAQTLYVCEGADV